MSVQERRVGVNDCLSRIDAATRAIGCGIPDDKGSNTIAAMLNRNRTTPSTPNAGNTSLCAPIVGECASGAEKLVSGDVHNTAICSSLGIN